MLQKKKVDEIGTRVGNREMVDRHREITREGRNDEVMGGTQRRCQCLFA